jgi:serine/threonine protein kinase
MIKKQHEIPKYAPKEIASTNNTNVYIVKLQAYDRPVIIKKFKDESYVGLMEYVVREVNFLINIRHSNIVSLLEIWPDSYLPTLIMENGGTDLWRYGYQITRYQRCLLTTPVFIQIFNGLNFLHNNKIIHRDLKSSNILIRINDNVIPPIPIVKLCDLGLARTQHYEMTPNSGTPNYRAPEILQSEIEYNEKVDMWAMGCIAYEWLEHKILFRGSDDILLEIIEKWMSEKSEMIQKMTCGCQPLEVKYMIYGQQLMEMLLITESEKRASAETCIRMLGSVPEPVLFMQKPIMIRKSIQVDLDIRHIIVVNIFDMEKYYDVCRRTLALGVDLFDKWLMLDNGNDDMVLYSIAAVILASYKYNVLLPVNFASKYSEDIIIEAVQILFQRLCYNVEYLDLWSLMCKIIREHDLPKTNDHIEHYWKRVCDILLDYNSIFAKTEQDLIGLLDRIVD